MYRCWHSVTVVGWVEFRRTRNSFKFWYRVRPLLLFARRHRTTVRLGIRLFQFLSTFFSFPCVWSLACSCSSTAEFEWRSATKFSLWRQVALRNDTSLYSHHLSDAGTNGLDEAFLLICTRFALFHHWRFASATGLPQCTYSRFNSLYVNLYQVWYY